MLPPLYYYITWDVVEIALLATYAFNAIMPLSRASTRGRYSRIEGVTPVYLITFFCHCVTLWLMLMDLVGS